MLYININCNYDDDDTMYFNHESKECEICDSDQSYIGGDVGNRTCVVCDTSSDIFLDSGECVECSLEGCLDCESLTVCV